MSAHKVHYVANSRTLCNTPLQYNAHPDRTTPYRGETTCLRCLYNLGLYVPLSKLAEHQERERKVATMDRTGNFASGL